MNTGWEKVGVVGVDAGLIWLGDPCYIIHSDNDNPDLGEDWHDFVHRLYPNEGKQHDDGVRQWNYALGHAGLGVTVGTGWGDGTYDVLVQRKEGRVMKVMIDFEGEEEQEEDDPYCYNCGEVYESCNGKCYNQDWSDEEEEDCS